ncbi:MAG: HlyD family efflux transporter periplasmic adaptor subunit, partial [Chloroflexota bacterium]|nr:HlyD family efflux transporter periplasmic adaptor subunit [Chloroflexota bacterium]
MKRTTWYLILVAIIVVAAVLGYVFVWRPRQAEQAEGETRSAVVERGAMLVAVSTSGNIEPQARVNLFFQSPGRVAEVLVEAGDRVAAGDVLARLDSERLALQVQQAQAALASAEAQLAQLTRGARPEEIAAAEANVRALEAQASAASASLDQLAGGPSDAQVAAAEAELASAITQQKSAQDAHDMTMKCFEFSWGGQKHNICPALGVPEEQARYNLNVADVTLAAAQSSLEETLAGADSDEIRASRANVWAAAAQRDAVQSQLELLLNGATEGQIAAAEAGVEQARVALELAELALEKAALRAPFDGVVAQVNAAANEMPPAQLPAITLLDLSQFRMTLSVDEMDVGRLAPGQSVQVTLDALPDVAVTGSVERVAPAATLQEGVVYYDVVIELDPIDAPIRADMTANATIVVEELSDVLLIPTWVVRVDRDTGQTYVDRQAGGGVVRTDVELGVRYKGNVQVLDGLGEGDVV